MFCHICESLCFVLSLTRLPGKTSKTCILSLHALKKIFQIFKNKLIIKTLFYSFYLFFVLLHNDILKNQKTKNPKIHLSFMSPKLGKLFKLYVKVSIRWFDRKQKEEVVIMFNVFFVCLLSFVVNNWSICLFAFA